MSAKMIMFIVFIFVSGTMLSLIIEGTYLGSGDEWDVMQSLTGYSSVNVAGAGGIAIPKVGVGFIMTGIPKILTWDYSFLTGGWAIIKWFILYPISAGIVYAMGLLIYNIATGILGAIR
jgi:hypothetical protein